MTVEKAENLYETGRHFRAVKTIMQLLLMLPVVLLITIVSVLSNMMGCSSRVKNERNGD